MNQADAELINGIPCGALRSLMHEVSEDPSKGKVKLQVEATWKGGVRSDSQVNLFVLSGERLTRAFTIRMDEPTQLLGDNTGPNPLEVFLAAFNACMLAGYVMGCSRAGIALESLTVESQGEFDLRGSLGLDAAVRPGYGQISYTVRIRGNGTPEEFQRIHEAVLATSPNRWNVANTIYLKAELIVE